MRFCLGGLNLSANVGRLISTVLDGSVGSQSLHSSWALALTLAYRLVSIPDSHPLPSSLFSLSRILSFRLLGATACFNLNDLIISFFWCKTNERQERDGSAVPNLIIYLLNRLLCYSPRAVVTDGCWEVKWAKCFVRMLPTPSHFIKLMQQCVGNLCQIQIMHI